MEQINKPPVEILIDGFGGVCAFARAMKKDPAAISRWRKHGRVPHASQKQALEVAWSNQILITAHEMIFGRDNDPIAVTVAPVEVESEREDTLGGVVED